MYCVVCYQTISTWESREQQAYSCKVKDCKIAYCDSCLIQWTKRSIEDQQQAPQIKIH